MILKASRDREALMNAVGERDGSTLPDCGPNPVQFARTGPTLIERAQGICLYAEGGHEVIDGMSGGWCTHLGYGNERLCRVAFEAMRQLSYTLTFGGRTNPWAAALSDKLASITPRQYEHFFFASTGSDAVESALKMALYYWHLRGQQSKRYQDCQDLIDHDNRLCNLVNRCINLAGLVHNTRFHSLGNKIQKL